MALRALVVCGFALLAARPALAAQQQLALSFRPDSVVVSGATPAATVYVYGLARESSNGFVSLVPRSAMLTDDDKNGVVELSVASGVALRSIWMAVDMSTGAYASGAPEGYPATRAPLSDANLKKKFGAEVTQLAFPGMLIDFLVVRPGSGAWRTTAGLRGPADEESDGESIAVSTLKLEPDAGTTERAPEKLKKGDVVFVLNSFRAEYGIARMGEVE